MITKKDVEHVAQLARLSISEEEKEMFTRQMADIVSYVELMNELDTSNVEPMAHAIPVTNVMREDISVNEYERSEMLGISPLEEEGFIRVPKIID